MSLWAPLTEAFRALDNGGWNQVQWENPWAFIALLFFVPVWFRIFRKPKPVLVFSRGDFLAMLPKGAKYRLHQLAKWSFVLGSFLAVVALSQPSAPGEPDPNRQNGIDIVAVLDVSGSMKSADFKPRDRLTVAKQVIAKYLLNRQQDRIGLVVFAGEAFTQTPLTHDKELLRSILAGVRTGLIQDGTAIGDAIATGTNRLRDSSAKSRALILITDGESNAGNLSPEQAADLAREMNVRVYSILVGREGRVPFPSGANDVFGMPKYNYVDASVNPTLLQSVAEKTDGRFFTAEDPAALAGSFQRILESLEKSVLEGGPVLRRQIDLSLLFLLPGVFLLFFGFWVAVTKGATIP